MTLLLDVLQTLASERDIEQITINQYDRAIRRFGAFLHSAADTRDLTRENANAWLMWLGEQYGLGPQSIVNYRTALIRIWNYAHEIDLCEACPVRRIRRPKQPERVVAAWTLAQLQVLLDTAATLPGWINGTIRASDFLVAWLWLGYETGLRPSDLRRLTWQDVDLANHTVRVIQKKTGGLHNPRIGPESVAALEKLQAGGYPQIFPCGKSGIYRWERILFREAAKHGFCRNKGQGLGTLRKTHATEIYREHGLAAAAESLGHRGATSTARKHYVATDARSGLLPPSPPKRAG